MVMFTIGRYRPPFWLQEVVLADDPCDKWELDARRCGHATRQAYDALTDPVAKRNYRPLESADMAQKHSC